ncbi:MAG: MCE family protein [Parachlamydiales bacterium]|nr:MCE family protein [Parachlamydiales bacterium]
MSDYIKNVLIGVFVLAALAASIWIILFMEPKVGDGKKILHVRFSDISGVNVGTRVNLAGRPVGEVIEIQKAPDARKEQTDPLGRVYFYLLVLRVDSSVEIYNTDSIAIQTTGLLGEKTIGIIPKAAEQGVKPKIVTNTVIYGDSIAPLEMAIHQISNVAEKMEVAIEDFDNWFMENHEELSMTVKSFGDAMKQIDTLIDNANKEQILASAKQAIDSFTASMDLVQDALQEAQDNDTMTKINTILENFAQASEFINDDGRQIAHNIAQITDDIAQGKGTLGKMVSSEDLYLRVVAIMSKVDTLMNDLNHYGLLFQYDKHWQRIRTKRANLLEALDTPTEFRSYYEKEIDDITTSLSRISTLMEKAEETNTKERIIQNTSFQCDFANLLRKLEEMLDSLKLYNEQILKTDCDHP